jgi:hypothetical protein
VAGHVTDHQGIGQQSNGWFAQTSESDEAIQIYAICAK